MAEQAEVERTSAAIYGTIVLASALAATESTALAPVILTGFFTVLIYWIAEEYAGALATRAVEGRITRTGTWTHLRRSLTMVEATLGPLLVVLAAGLLGASVRVAVTSGLVAASCLLGFFGAKAAQKAGAGPLGMAVSSLIATLLGGAVVALKLALH